MTPIPRPRTNSFIFESLEDEHVKFRAYFGDGAPLVTDGYGGWTVTGRPKDIGITEWQGRNPLAVEIPFLIDNYMFDPDATGWNDRWNTWLFNDKRDRPNELARCGATEDMVHVLGNLCGVGDSEQPPALRVDGHGVIPHDDSFAPGANKWVIESVAWDREIEMRSHTYGLRLRCGGMIVIRQYKDANDILRRLGPKNRARKPKIYTVKKGDKLQDIAKKEYGSAGKWKIIADANHLRDPRHLKPNTKLRIPR